MKKSIGRAISGVMVITLLCRVLALVANQLYISGFGSANLELNIYSYAISVPNIVFNSVGTAISTVVIPIFAGLAVNKKMKEANLFASNVLTVFGSIIVGLIAMGLAVSPILPRFTQFNTGDAYQFAVKALMIMMPVMLFYGVSFVFQGVLQSLGHYGFPAAVSLPSSLLIIGYVLLFSEKYGVTGLLWTTFVGLFMQAAILIGPAILAGFRFTLSFDIKNPHIRQAFSLIMPVLLGSGAFQINMFYSVTLMANFKSTVTMMTFVQNIVINTVLAVVYSVTAVLYPKMTRELASGDSAGYKQTLTGGISSFVFLFLPATMGMILVRNPLMNLISGYGKVTEGDVHMAGAFLAFYALALTSIALKELLDRGFFAAKNTKTPAVCGFITVGANVILSQVAIRFFGPYGIPLAYSLACFCSVLFLLIKMRKAIGGFGAETKKIAVTSLLATVLMGVGVWIIMAIMPPISGFAGRIAAVAVPAFVGVAIYGVAGLCLKNPMIMKVLKR